MSISKQIHKCVILYRKIRSAKEKGHLCIGVSVYRENKITALKPTIPGEKHLLCVRMTGCCLNLLFLCYFISSKCTELT